MLSLLKARICLFPLALGLFAYATANCAPEERFSVLRDGARCTILRGKEKYLTVDLAPYTKDGTALWPSQRQPLSPDGAYLPLYVLDKNTQGSDILLLDVRTGTVVRNNLLEMPTYRMATVTWLAPRVLGIPSRAPIEECLIHSVNTNKTKHLTGEGVVVCDSQGANYASVFGKLHWITRHGQTRIYPEQLLVSEALRYNSYWVYPTPLTGFMTEVEYVKWQSDIGIRESGKGKGEPPIIRSCGVAIDRNHVLSAPIFVENTTWVGFFEQVYPIGKFDQVLESNVVLLDAHRVHTNPPVAGDILVKKNPIPSVVPTTHSEYIHLATTRVAQWNGETRCLELWETQGLLVAPYQMKKIGEVPIDLTRMEMGSYRPVDGQWIKADETQ
jgi:hypothetical protein